MSRERKLVLGSAVAAGVAAWWAVFLVMRSLADVLLITFGEDSSYDGNAALAAFVYAPAIGACVGLAVWLFGLALTPSPPAPAAAGRGHS